MSVREKINKLAHGIISSTTPLVCVEPKAIDFDLSCGESQQTQVELSASGDFFIKGLAYSSDIRVTVLTPSFGGYKVSVRIEAFLRSTDEEHEFKCDLTLVTNCGEYVIPITVTRKSVSSDDLLSNFRSINDFAKVAYEDKSAALQIFMYRNFVKAPFMDDIRYVTLYRSLLPSSDKEAALKQFLIGCGIEKPVFEEVESSESVTSPELYDQDDTPVQDSPGNSDDVSAIAAERRAYYKKSYFEYARLRLKFEMHNGKGEDLIPGMEENLNRLIYVPEYSLYIRLLKAELCYLSGDISGAEYILKNVEPEILENRQEYLREYFLLEYLNIVLYNRENKISSFLRLCRKFIEEDRMHYLFFYVLKLDDDLIGNDAALHSFLTDVYNYGSRSPLLYFYYTGIINSHPEYLYNPRAIDTQAINFARKYNILSDSISSAVVSASCSSYIKADRRSVSVHKTYSDGVDLNLNIIGLYEYYMYSVPEDADYIIKDNVLEHYRLNDNLDRNSKIRLYSNVVRFKSHNSGLYRSYEERINRLAFDELKEGNIDPYLAVIYKSIIKPSVLSKDYIDKLFNICHTYSVKTDNKYIRSIVVVYSQLNNPETFSCREGNATVRIHDANALLVFQDAFGNRYVDINYTIEPMLDSYSLRSYVEKMASDNQIYITGKCVDLIQKKSLSSEDIAFLEEAIYKLNISDSFRTQIITRLIKYYNQHTATGYNPDFLLRINKNSLSKEERIELCNAYVSCNRFDEAYEMVSSFGFEGIDDKNLKKLCSNSVLTKPDEKDSVLVYLAVYTFNKSLFDRQILDYLAKSYNGPTEIMYRVLQKCVESGCETYDLEERLLAQIIFTNDYGRMDQVFNWYISRKKVSESILKAYFTLKTIDYFVNDSEQDSKLFLYLEKIADGISDIVKIPVIYMLALTKHYTREKNLTQKQIDTSELYIRFLCDADIIFPYFKEFDKYFILPSKLLNSVILVHKSESSVAPELISRTKPQEKSFRQDYFSSTYLNLHIKQVVLFDGEEWDYIIKDSINGSENQTKGTLIPDGPDKGNGKYESINSFCQSFADGDDDETAKRISSYIIRNNVSETLYRIN